MFIFAPRDTMSTSRQGSASRRNRYARSSTTTSVTQLLSDSCTSLLQKLTTRVRGTSTLNDRGRSPNIRRLGSTRSRLEDKYNTILERCSGKRPADDSEQNARCYSRKERDHSYYHRDDSPFVRDDKTLEPSMSRTVIKSPTSVLLSEKAYPYVSSAISKESRREKTPAYGRTDRTRILLNSEAYRRYGRHKSGHTETRSRKIRPHRNGKSEQLETHSTSLKLSRPIKIEPFMDGEEVAIDPDKTPVANAENNESVAKNAALTAEDDPTISDRVAKRKEIQSLILKYAAMEDTYSQLASIGQAANVRPSTTDLIASKYRKSNHCNNQKDHASKNAITSNAISEMNAIVSYRTTCPGFPRKRRLVLSRALPLLSCLSRLHACVCMCVCINMQKCKLLRPITSRLSVVEHSLFNRITAMPLR